MTLGSIFQWIYCLNFSEALLLLVICTGVFYILRAKLVSHRVWMPAVGAVLIAWAAVVIAHLVLQRTPDPAVTPIWTPFRSYVDALKEGGRLELLRSNFMNVILFYPAGLLGCELIPESWKNAKRVAVVVVVLLLLSIGIEYFQFRFGLGLSETDDVIHNTLGAFLGALAAVLAQILRKNR